MEELQEKLIKCLYEDEDYEKFELLFLRAVVNLYITRTDLSKIVMCEDIIYQITSNNLIDLFKVIYPFIDIRSIDIDKIKNHCNLNNSWLIIEHIEKMENPINKIKKVNESIEGKYKYNKEEVDIDDELVIYIKYPISWNDSLALLDKHGIIYSKYHESYGGMISEFAKRMIRTCCLGKGMSTNDIDMIIDHNLGFAYSLYYNRDITEEKMQKLEDHIFNPKTYDNVYKFKAK